MIFFVFFVIFFLSAPVVIFIYFFCMESTPSHVPRRMSITYGEPCGRARSAITPAPCFAGHMGFDMIFCSFYVDLMLHGERLKLEADILSA